MTSVPLRRDDVVRSRRRTRLQMDEPRLHLEHGRVSIKCNFFSLQVNCLDLISNFSGQKSEEKFTVLEKKKTGEVCANDQAFQLLTTRVFCEKNRSNMLECSNWFTVGFQPHKKQALTRRACPVSRKRKADTHEHLENYVLS